MYFIGYCMHSGKIIAFYKDTFTGKVLDDDYPSIPFSFKVSG